MISYQIIEHGQPLQKKADGDAQAAGHRSPDANHALRRVPLRPAHLGRLLRPGRRGKRFYVKERGCIPPFTLGHEPFGIVEAVGKKVKGVKVGQKRLIYPWIGCGKCAVCKAGQDNYCVSGTRFLGVNRAGAYSTHVLVPDPKYLVDTAGIDDSFASTLACSAGHGL